MPPGLRQRQEGQQDARRHGYSYYYYGSRSNMEKKSHLIHNLKIIVLSLLSILRHFHGNNEGKRCFCHSLSFSSHRQPNIQRYTTVPTFTQLGRFVGKKENHVLYALGGMSDREREIRLKISQLKKQGKLKKKGDNIFDGMDDDIDDDDDNDNDVKTDYSDKIRQKLGSAKSKMLGYTGSNADDESSNNDRNSEGTSKILKETQRTAQIGALKSNTQNTENTSRQKSIESDDFEDSENTVVDDDEDDDDDSDNELEEEDLIELVARKMKAKRELELREREERLQAEAKVRLERLEMERQKQVERKRLETTNTNDNQATLDPTKEGQLTSGIGGSWTKNDDDDNDATEDTYQPKSGSWGAFPRPRDISKAYGGGRRVGPGYSNESERMKSENDTLEKLKNYRVKMGIDVESEKEHADEINDALNIAGVAMQRGMYSTAVTALEKVSKYCSTNSKVGGKVFLELAMAYEAIGRTKEAITVYSTLSRSRIEKIKINAKRLLYGIEAMQFMQDNVGSSEFSRKKAKTTFIDTTGLGDIASKFDDRYETAYVDLNSKNSFYKRLTESVVRSPREAKQILLRATGPGEVERLRIVQALRSLNRKFDEELNKEIELNAPAPEPTAVMNGVPILQQPQQQKRTTVSYDDNDGYDDDDDLDKMMMQDEFVLKDASRMKDTLMGEWKLQLLADKRGDGVKFFNTSVAWQVIDTDTMSFTSTGPSAFISIQQNGNIQFNDKRRILRRSNVEMIDGAGGMICTIFGSTITRTGAVGAVNTPQQVVLVDSVLLLTRNVPSKFVRGAKVNADDEKDYFALWRRVEQGTYSSTLTSSKSKLQSSNSR